MRRGSDIKSIAAARALLDPAALGGHQFRECRGIGPHGLQVDGKTLPNPMLARYADRLNA